MILAARSFAEEDTALRADPLRRPPSGWSPADERHLPQTRQRRWGRNLGQRRLKVLPQRASASGGGGVSSLAISQGRNDGGGRAARRVSCPTPRGRR